MDNKFQLAKNYNIQQDYTLNAYIDTKDTVNHWCVGQIVDVNEANNQLRVHFEGWSARYDEVSHIYCMHIIIHSGSRKTRKDWRHLGGTPKVTPAKRKPLLGISNSHLLITKL